MPGVLTTGPLCFTDLDSQASRQLWRGPHIPLLHLSLTCLSSFPPLRRCAVTLKKLCKEDNSLSREQLIKVEGAWRSGEGGREGRGDCTGCGFGILSLKDSLKIFTLLVLIIRKRDPYGPWAGGWVVSGAGGPGHGTRVGGRAVPGQGAELAH